MKLPDLKVSALPLDKFKTIDLKSFSLGLVGIAAFYTLVFVYVVINSKTTIETLEKTLASHTVKINAGDVAEQPAHESKKGIKLVEGLAETSAYGNLPIIRKSDGLTSFRAYQQPFEIAKLNKPAIAFVVTDFGLSRENSDTSIQLLPPEVSFVLSPYSNLPQEWVKLALEEKHEVWMNLQTETRNLNVTDTGSFTLLTSATYTGNQKILHWTMGRALGYVGMSSFTDDIILKDQTQFSKLADEIYTRGLGYLELNPTADKLVENAALSNNGPYVRADIQVTRMKGANSFEALEKIAQEKGYAVAVIPNYPENIKQLAQWCLKIAKNDYVLVPASAIFDLPLMQAAHTNGKAEKAGGTLKNTDMLLPQDIVQH